jgi:hypothetical protein
VSKKTGADKTPPDRQRQLQAAFAAYVRDPDNNPPPAGIEERRLAIYRRLFFGNLRNLMAKNFPVLRRMLDDDEWERLIRDLLACHRSTTPLFPEIGQEMLAYLRENGQAWLTDRPWMVELVEWEYLETRARLHEAEVAAPVERAGNTLDQPLGLNPTLQTARYQWPVHRIGPAFIPAEMLAQPINLLVYRCHDDQVAFERINDLTLRFLMLAQPNAGASGRVLLAQLAEISGINPPDSVIQAGEAMLGHLIEREIIQLI